ncbi:MazG nucleotide pyrophosphohydrolase domain-containing protein [Streptomyces anulatus]|uniref:MazG nucleotide pyrophosphohydrolase domain-containing protein n=1 Tax=Streptomyces anulatus TaxID=1892 RepID=UPI00386EEAA9
MTTGSRKTSSRGTGAAAGELPTDLPTGSPGAYNPYGADVREGVDGVPLTGAVLLALLAAEHADVCVIGALTADAAEASYELCLAAPDRNPFPVGARPVVVRGTVAYGGDLPGGLTGWLPIRCISVVEHDGSVTDTAGRVEEERLAILREAGLAAAEVYDGPQEGGGRLTDVQRRVVRAAEEETLVPLAKAGGRLAETFAGALGDEAVALRRIQEQCRDLYGRLEPERALAWALEELGELSQAMRRDESTVRVEEELGQVLVWALCLANITRTDAAHAFAKGFTAERDRQLRKHGAIRPYRREVPSC